MVRAGLSPERLTLAAAELADEAGLEQVTVAAVARLFGVRAPSLYSHVSSSDDLRRRVALLALSEMADLLAAALAGRSGREALALYARTYRDYAHAHPGRYDAAALRLPPDVAATSAGPRHAELARAVLRGYRIGGDEQTHAVRVLGATVRGFVDLEQAGGFDHSAPGVEESWERMVDALDVLLRRWPGERSQDGIG